MTSPNARSTSMRNLPCRATRASRRGMCTASSGRIPLGSGEYHRISPSAAIGNHPRAYADTRSWVEITIRGHSTGTVTAECPAGGKKLTRSERLHGHLPKSGWHLPERCQPPVENYTRYAVFAQPERIDDREFRNLTVPGTVPVECPRLVTASAGRSSGRYGWRGGRGSGSRRRRRRTTGRGRR